MKKVPAILNDDHNGCKKQKVQVGERIYYFGEPMLTQKNRSDIRDYIKKLYGL